MGRQLSSKNMDREDGLYTCKGVTTKDNVSSNADLCEILYTREGGMELYPPDRTPKGAPSVSAPTLKLLLEHIDEELDAPWLIGSIETKERRSASLWCQVKALRSCWSPSVLLKGF